MSVVYIFAHGKMGFISVYKKTGRRRATWSYTLQYLCHENSDDFSMKTFMVPWSTFCTSQIASFLLSCSATSMTSIPLFPHSSYVPAFAGTNWSAVTFSCLAAPMLSFLLRSWKQEAKQNSTCKPNRSDSKGQGQLRKCTDDRIPMVWAHVHAFLSDFNHLHRP